MVGEASRYRDHLRSIRNQAVSITVCCIITYFSISNTAPKVRIGFAASSCLREILILNGIMDTLLLVRTIGHPVLIRCTESVFNTYVAFYNWASFRLTGLKSALGGGRSLRRRRQAIYIRCVRKIDDRGTRRDVRSAGPRRGSRCSWQHNPTWARSIRSRRHNAIILGCIISPPERTCIVTRRAADQAQARSRRCLSMRLHRTVRAPPEVWRLPRWASVQIHSVDGRLDSRGGGGSRLKMHTRSTAPVDEK